MVKVMSTTQRVGKKKATPTKVPKTAPQPFRKTKSGGPKRPVVRTKTSTLAKPTASVNMDSYIEDLLSDHKAVDILQGSLTDKHDRIIRYHIKEFPGSYCSITITASYSKQKWAVYVPIAVDLKGILAIWRTRPLLERRDLLGAWVLHSSGIEFDHQGKICGVNFEHNGFRVACQKYFFQLLNKAVVPSFQAVARGFLARKRVCRLREQLEKSEHSLEDEQQRMNGLAARKLATPSSRSSSSSRIDKKAKKPTDVSTMRKGSALESSIILDDDSSVESWHDFAGEEEVEEDPELERMGALRGSDRLLSSSPNEVAAEVEEDILSPLMPTRSLFSTDELEIEEDQVLKELKSPPAGSTAVRSHSDPRKEVQSELKREIKYLSRPPQKASKKKKKEGLKRSSKSSSTSTKRSVTSSASVKVLKKTKAAESQTKKVTGSESGSGSVAMAGMDTGAVASRDGHRMSGQLSGSRKKLPSPARKKSTEAEAGAEISSSLDDIANPVPPFVPASAGSDQQLELESELELEKELEGGLLPPPSSLPVLGDDPRSPGQSSQRERSNTGQLSQEINDLRDLVQAQMTSFIGEVGALTLSIKNNSKNNSPRREIEDKSSLCYHEEVGGESVVSAEESQFEELAEMKSEILELRSLVGELKSNLNSSSVADNHQQNLSQQENEFKEDSPLLEGVQESFVEPDRGEFSCAEDFEEAVDEVQRQDSRKGGEFASVNISGEGEMEFEMPGVVPPWPQPHEEVKQEQEGGVSSESDFLHHVRDSVNVNREVLDSTTTPCSAAGSGQRATDDEADGFPDRKQKGESKRKRKKHRRDQKKLAQPSPEIADTNLFLNALRTHEKESHALEDVEGKHIEAKPKIHTESLFLDALLADTERTEATEQAPGQGEAEEISANIVESSKHNHIADNNEDRNFQLNDVHEDKEDSGYFDAIDHADDFLQQHLDTKAKEELERKELQRVALPVLAKFFACIMEKRNRIKYINNLVLHHSADKSGGFSPLSLGQIRNDMQRSLDLGSIKLAVLSLQSLNEYFVATSRLKIVIAVVKDCPNLSKFLVKFLYSFISVREVAPETVVSINILLQQYILVPELLGDGLVVCLMNAAHRQRTVPDFIFDIIDIFEYLLVDVPEGYTPDTVMTPEALSLLITLLPHVARSDEKTGRKVYTFINTLCLEQPEFVTTLEQLGFFPVLVNSCYDLVNSMEVLTLALWTCKVFVEHAPNSVQLLNNQGHAELIVECLISFTHRVDLDVALSHFSFVVELLLTLCTNCPSFIRNFPMHHFLANMHDCLGRGSGGPFAHVVLQLLLSMLKLYPSVKKKVLLNNYSEVIVPLLAEGGVRNDIQEAAASLHLILFPEWSPLQWSDEDQRVQQQRQLHMQRNQHDPSAQMTPTSRQAPSTLRRYNAPLEVSTYRPTSPLTHRSSSPMNQSPARRTPQKPSSSSPRSASRPRLVVDKQSVFPPWLADNDGGQSFNTSRLVPAEGRELDSGSSSISKLLSDSSSFRSSSTPPLSPGVARAPFAPTSAMPSMRRPSSRPIARVMSQAHAMSVISNIVFRHLAKKKKKKKKKKQALFSAVELKSISGGDRRVGGEECVEEVPSVSNRSTGEELKKKEEYESTQFEAPIAAAASLGKGVKIKEKLEGAKFSLSASQGHSDMSRESSSSTVGKNGSGKSLGDRSRSERAAMDKPVSAAENADNETMKKDYYKRARSFFLAGKSLSDASIDKSNRSSGKNLNVESHDVIDGSRNHATIDKTAVASAAAANIAKEIRKKGKKEKTKSEGSENATSEREEKDLAVAKEPAADDDSSAGVCMSSLTFALDSNNEILFLETLNKIIDLVHTELETGGSEMSSLLLSQLDIVLAGVQVFFKLEKQVAVLCLDVLWLLKSKMKKKINLKKNNLFDILSDIMQEYLDDIDICKKVFRLYGKKSMNLADASYVELLVAILRKHLQDRTIRSETVKMLTSCISRDPSFQTTVTSAGGCALVLDLYASYGSGKQLETLVTFILLLANDNVENATFFGSTQAIMIFLQALLQNVDSESSFNLATVPFFYAIKTFTDPETFHLDECVLAPISSLFEYAEGKGNDSGRNNAVIEWTLKLIRELCTVQSSMHMFRRSGFSLVISQFIQPEHTNDIRKLAKSIMKKLVKAENS